MPSRIKNGVLIVLALLLPDAVWAFFSSRALGETVPKPAPRDNEPDQH